MRELVPPTISVEAWAGVRSYLTPAQKIKQILSRLKDPIPPQDACGVVYHIKCDGSEAEDESPFSESHNPYFIVNKASAAAESLFSNYSTVFCN